MSFISAGFFMAMALTACLYYLIPKKYQWELLLCQLRLLCHLRNPLYGLYFVYDYYKLLYYKADGCTERKAYATQMADIRAGFQFRNSCLFKVCQFYNTESDFIVFGISSGISAWKAFNCDAAWNFFLYIPDNELRDRCLSEKI